MACSLASTTWVVPMRPSQAYFDQLLTSVLPSSTGVSWATTITGVNPVEHGVAGNEFFVRDTGQFAAPVPEATPVFKIYTDDYANKLLEAPTMGLVSQIANDCRSFRSSKEIGA